jgi:hypothetical protein
MSIKNSEFNSNLNKEIIWNLLIEYGAFNDIDNKFFSVFKQNFENTVLKYSLSSDPILELNKRVLQDILKETENYKTTRNPEMLISAADVSASRQAAFQKGLQTKQNEFTQMINKSVPNKIDFSDPLPTLDEEPSEMDKKLAEVIARREQQMNMVLATQQPPPAPVASKDKFDTPTSTILTLPNNRNLKIGAELGKLDVVNLNLNLNLKNDNNNPSIATKKVSFNDLLTTSFSGDESFNPFSDMSDIFLSKLKKKETLVVEESSNSNSRENMIELIKNIDKKQDIINSKQDIIIALLNKHAS